MPTALRGHVLKQSMPTQSRGHGTRRIFPGTLRRFPFQSCAITATTTRAAPAIRSARAAALAVAPVVSTSSTSKIVFPRKRPSALAANAPRTLSGRGTRGEERLLGRGSNPCRNPIGEIDLQTRCQCPRQCGRLVVTPRPAPPPMQWNRYNRTRTDGLKRSNGVSSPQIADRIGESFVIAVFHAQHRVTTNPFIRTEPNDPLERKRFAAALGTIGRRRQIRTERAGASWTGRVRIDDERIAAIGAEIARADRRRPSAEKADAGISEVQQTAGEITSECGKHQFSLAATRRLCGAERDTSSALRSAKPPRRG